MKWTELEINYLTDNLNKTSLELSKILSRSSKSIIRKIKQLNLLDEYKKNNLFIGKYIDEKKEEDRRLNISNSCKKNKKSGGLRMEKVWLNTTKSKKILKKECICGEKIYNNSKNCKKCYDLNQRKVKNRPSIDDLINDVKLIGYVKTGRKYDVSDNTIRKWIKIGN
jgi:hypothetical protein